MSEILNKVKEFICTGKIQKKSKYYDFDIKQVKQDLIKSYFSYPYMCKYSIRINKRGKGCFPVIVIRLYSGNFNLSGIEVSLFEKIKDDVCRKWKK